MEPNRTNSREEVKKYERKITVHCLREHKKKCENQRVLRRIHATDTTSIVII